MSFVESCSGRSLFAVVFILNLVGFDARAVTEDFKLIAADGAADDAFGWRVAIDGDVALVGADFDDDDGTSSGSAYVFRRVAGSWVQEAKLTASDGDALSKFGGSVSISGDLALIGAHGDFDNGQFSGSAYVFRFDGANWIEEAKILASDGEASDQFGISVAISGDTAFVGALTDDPGTQAGSVYVFEFNGASWVEEANLTASDASNDDRFGTSISTDGDVLIVGAFRDGASGLRSGSAYVFRYSGSSWDEEEKIVPSDGGPGDYFGYSVSVSGNAAIVGAIEDDVVGLDTGYAYVFRFDSANWVEETKIAASDATIGDRFGDSVSIDGDVALVGASNDNDGGTDSGSAYAFFYNGFTWVQGQKLTASDAQAFDQLGRSVALSGDTALVGGWFSDGNAPDSGAAYVFSQIPSPTVPSLSPLGTSTLLCLLCVTAYWRFGRPESTK